MIELVNYESKYQPDFKRLNLEWLDKYNLTESHDLDILDDPQGTVIAGGGYLFLAMEYEKVIGSAGLLRENDREYELVKMAVDPLYQGKGIGKLLIHKCLDKARELKAQKVFLFSNSQLQTAIGMYTKYGFSHVTVTGTPLLTADVKMELSLSPNQS